MKKEPGRFWAASGSCGLVLWDKWSFNALYSGKMEGTVSFREKKKAGVVMLRPLA